MRHQMQDLTRFSLEFQGFFTGIYTHLYLQNLACYLAQKSNY